MVTRRSIDWLCEASDDPQQFRMVWSDDPRQPQVVATGALFDVVATDQQLGIEALDQLRRRGMPVSAVLIDRAARRTGFMVPPDTQGVFERTLARETSEPLPYRYLGDGSYVVLPGPVPLPGDRFEWLNPLKRRQHCSPLQTVALAVMLAASADLIARAEQYGLEPASG
ncbi:bifunctional DNA primase/polymerase [Streptomyces sp. NPDC020983]|uniref:bifunctional DNA primase/polymerase n=1 Tax=Streptomyces sp. NPDC020983 TaxID=3365106 RepID=UPI0037A00BB6